ncbi:MAG: bifunctional folylpolyglutamate synthase/dihydrofolate synthase [Aquabacterium sp.]
MAEADALPAVWARLEALIDWERAQRARNRVDLSAQTDLLDRLGRPQQACRVVHVTGTKGKGSVCALIEAGLTHAGWRAGRYASPHLEHVTERITVGGVPIAEDAMAGVLQQALDARDAAVVAGTPGREASWFDVVTAAAFVHNAQAGLDWAVVEVGIGGRLDSTNVVQPDLAIITNVGLEHTDVLGDTVEKIAAEKAGIIKAGVSVLTAIVPDTPAGEVVRAAAQRQGSVLTWLPPAGSGGIAETNRALARTALRLLGERGVVSPRRGMPLGPQDLPDAVAQAAGLPGRLEAFDLPWPQTPASAAPLTTAPLRVVLDGAHVGFALAAVLAQLQQQPAQAGPAVVLLAIGADKHAQPLVAALQGRAAHVVCTELDHGRRSWPATDLARLCTQQGLSAEVAAHPRDGLARCLQRVAPGQWLLVTGSLYLVGELRAAVRQAGVPA